MFSALVMSALLTASVGHAGDWGPGDRTHLLLSECRLRSYLVHIPPCYRRGCPMPVVVALHGLTANGRMLARFSGLNEKADRCGFIVVYPNGGLLAFNAGGVAARRGPDDVAFINRMLDELSAHVCVDQCRVYATGLSNGGMMCYRLACELSHRFAAIASVSGPMAILDCCPCHPVSVLHFHGTCDRELPYNGPRKGEKSLIQYHPVTETIAIWAARNGCTAEPMIEQMPDRCPDCTTVTRTTYGPGCCGAEVVLYTINGGGHTWPGREPPARFMGLSTKDIVANDIMWEFFLQHPRCCLTPVATE